MCYIGKKNLKTLVEDSRKKLMGLSIKNLQTFKGINERKSEDCLVEKTSWPMLKRKIQQIGKNAKNP